MMQFLTDFADQAAVLPLSVIVACVVLASGWRRGAVAWACTVGGVLGLMLVIKVVTLSCGQPWATAEVKSPSGHTASAAAVYGGLLALLARRVAGHGRYTLACAAAAAGVIGASRLSLGVHTVPEVVIGGAVGIVGACALTRWAGPPPVRLRLDWLAGAALAAIVTLHGYRLPAESALERVAGLMWPSSCPA